MKIKDIVAPLEEFAPPGFQEPYDNSGLIVGRADDEADSALLCVDATEEVLDEAERLGVRLVVSHHPIIFHPLKHLRGESYVERVVERAVRKGIALYACHTNLDNAQGGMSYRLAELLGVSSLRVLDHDAGAEAKTGRGSSTGEPVHGAGVVGTLAEATGTMEFLRDVQRKLRSEVVRHSDITTEKVRTVALCAGSGASLIEAAKDAGAQLYIAADFKYNDFMAADGKLVLADVGHFESEFCAIELMHDVISKKLATFALYKSKSSRNPVSYLSINCETKR